MEFGKQGIRINAVLPAAIETDMYERFILPHGQVAIHDHRQLREAPVTSAVLLARLAMTVSP